MNTKPQTIKISLAVLAAVILLVCTQLYRTTGFLQAQAIDENDLAHFEFSDEGVIVGAEEYTLSGTSGKCWVMVHGYTSTPDELRIVAEAVHSHFNDTIYVPRLYGHGMVSSAVEHYTVDQWYAQVAGLTQTHECEHLLGSSMGASLALRYAEQHEVKKLVLAGLPFELHGYIPLPEPLATPVSRYVVRYLKRETPGQTVDDPQGRMEHITGYSFPLKGVVEIAAFNEEVEADLALVSADVLFLHAPGDTVAGIEGARRAYDQLEAPKTFVELLGDHIVFRDYDKEQAVAEVIAFRTG